MQSQSYKEPTMILFALNNCIYTLSAILSSVQAISQPLQTLTFLFWDSSGEKNHVVPLQSLQTHGVGRKQWSANPDKQ